MAYLLDPTFVYMLLITGLWLGITALYIPGTGLPEGAALLTIGGALFAMLYMPTNWLSVLLLIGGMAAFVVIPLISTKHTRWAHLALGVQAVGSAFLFRGTMPNPLLILTMLGIAFVYYHFLLIPMMAQMRELPLVGDDMSELLGAEGRVTSPVTDAETGTAQVNGELWTIRSNVPLERGDIVRVLDVQGLELQVERVKSKRPPQTAHSNGTHEHPEPQEGANN
jgi:membrane-bound serine protease (ClpP class)